MAYIVEFYFDPKQKPSLIWRSETLIPNIAIGDFVAIGRNNYVVQSRLHVGNSDRDGKLFDVFTKVLVVDPKSETVTRSGPGSITEPPVWGLDPEEQG